MIEIPAKRRYTISNCKPCFRRARKRSVPFAGEASLARVGHDPRAPFYPPYPREAGGKESEEI